MKRYFCDRCDKQMGGIIPLLIIFNKQEISLCLSCRKEFFKFIGRDEQGVPKLNVSHLNESKLNNPLSIDKRLEDLKRDINSKRTQWTNQINKILE